MCNKSILIFIVTYKNAYQFISKAKKLNWFYELKEHRNESHFRILKLKVFNQPVYDYIQNLNYVLVSLIILLFISFTTLKYTEINRRKPFLISFICYLKEPFLFPFISMADTCLQTSDSLPFLG